MKLVEMLAKVVSEWPKGAGLAVQDGDKLKTVKFGHSTATPSIALLGREKTWQATNWNFSADSDFDHKVLSSDWETAVVTKAQWQAERDRQNGGEWKRHRGNGKQPKELGDFPFEVKHRDGNIWPVKGIGESCWRWTHDGSNDDIMQYRIISQPQAEEVEMIKVDPVAAENVEAFNGQWQFGQVDGPIKWRDTIIHCQAIIEDCEREIQRNVDLLDAEGLMMQADSKKAMQHYAKSATIPSDEWTDGDIVRCVDTGLSCAELTLGNEYTVVTRHGEIGVIDDEDDHMCSCIDNGELEFVRRP